MKESLQVQQEQALRTECGRTMDNVFKAIKLMRDEQHNFHIIYRTYTDEYVYSFCNPFLDTDTITYTIISVEEAKSIFLPNLSEENAQELFGKAPTTITPMPLQ